MLDNLKKYELVLASQSPRRQELLRDLGLRFTVKTSMWTNRSQRVGLTECGFPGRTESRSLRPFLKNNHW
jgi:hypothetical protein